MDSFVSKLKMEKDDLALKFNRAVMETNILTKELEQLKKEYGELLLGNSETQHQLAETGEECGNLRMNLAMANQEVQRLKDEFGQKIRGFTDEVKILRKQNMQFAEENAGLEAAKSKIEEELRDIRLYCESLKSKSMRLEEEMEETRKKEKKLLVKLKEAEKHEAENFKLSMKNNKLQGDLKAVTAAATERYRTLEKRLSELERVVAILSENSLCSGSQLIDTTQVLQEQESFGHEANFDGLAGGQSGHEATPNEEGMASSFPSPKAFSGTHVKEQPESSVSDTRPPEPVEPQTEAPAAEEKSASMPFVHKSTSAPHSVVDLCSSDDDDDELPLPKGLKRKLPSSEVSTKREDDDSCSSKYRLMEQKDLTPGSRNYYSASAVSLGIKTDMKLFSHSKETTAALKQCEQKFGMTFDGKYHSLLNDESGNPKKVWEYEADLFEDLMKDTVLCMKGICALYRQQQYMLNAYRATALVKFLTDGNTKGGLKRTLADLENYDPKGVDDCRSIAMAHSKQLFNIFKNGKDPFFAPDKVFC